MNQREQSIDPVAKRVGTMLNVIGVICMVGMILLCLPFTLPRIFGYEIYEVLTESMEPAISPGSVIYVTPTNGSQVEVDDIITFTIDSATDLVMTHRVVEVDSENKQLITQGDANDAVDEAPVSFDRVIGKVVFVLPLLAPFANFLQTTSGQLTCILIFVFAFLCFRIGDSIKKLPPVQREHSTTELLSDVKDILEEEAKMGPSQDPGFLAEQEEALAAYDADADYREVVGMPDGVNDTIVDEAPQRDWISTILYLGGSFCIALALFLLVPSIYGYVTARITYNKISVAYTQEVSESSDVDVSVVPDWYTLDVDFDGLLSENEDVVGWITVDGIDVINYPILQGTNNNHYLHYNIEGNYASSGSIFLDSGCASDFTDGYSIVYGHNMKDGSMFGSLKRYKREENFYSDGNKYFTIYTASGAYRYQIFAYSDVSYDDEIYSLGVTWGEEFTALMNRLISISYVNGGIGVENGSHVVTLSTCSSSSTSRFIVTGVRVDSYEKETADSE